MESDDLAGMVVALVVIAFIAAVVIAGVFVLMAVGVPVGAGIGLKNYYHAFRDNVQMERATP